MKQKNNTKNNKINKIIVLSIIIILIIIIIIKIFTNNNVNSDFSSQIELFVNDVESEVQYALKNRTNTELIITDEERINFALAYIKNNKEKYKNDIVKEVSNIEYDNYGSNYYTHDHIKKEVVQNIVFEIFGIENIDVTKYKFYNIKLDKIALIITNSESLSKSNFVIENIEKGKNNTYKVKIKYTNLTYEDKKTSNYYMNYILKYDKKNQENKFKIIEVTRDK